MATDLRKSKQAKARATALSPRAQPTCLALTGFGTRTDYMTGRVLDLDKTFEQLIRPACDQVGVNCFRNIDLNFTGSVDATVYSWIYEADIVIADISTLNAQVFYELGLRHALKPNITIVIAESILIERVPLDLSAFVVHRYRHGGSGIDADEQRRFVAHLASILKAASDEYSHGLKFSPQILAPADSPVYQFLSGLQPPTREAGAYSSPPVYGPPAERAKRGETANTSLASTIEVAELHMRTRKHQEAAEIFALAIRKQVASKANGKPDVYLAQRLALATYKAGERRDEFGNLSKERAIGALNEAESILFHYCEPSITNDPETIGIAGAINKRLFDLTGSLPYLDRSIRYYERGFYIKQDYYNGINVAFMYSVQATLLEDWFGAIASYGHGNTLRRHVVEICKGLIDDKVTFDSRSDREWIVLSLAEAYLGLGQTSDAALLQPFIDGISDFAKQTYQNQADRLSAVINDFEIRLASAGAAAATRPPQIVATMDIGANPASMAAPAPATSLTPAVAGFVELWVGELLRQINVRSPMALPSAFAAQVTSATNRDIDDPHAHKLAAANLDLQAVTATNAGPMLAPTSIDHSPTAGIKRSKIFLSYSHRDHEWLDLVKQHLRGLQNTGLTLDVWDDSKIRPGKQWKPAIDIALSEAKVAVLLITKNYLASDFIVNNELPPLLAAARQNGTEILSVLCSPVHWEPSPLSAYQAINDPETEALAELPSAKQDRILIRLARHIEDRFSLKGRVDPEQRD